MMHFLPWQLPWCFSKLNRSDQRPCDQSFKLYLQCCMTNFKVMLTGAHSVAQYEISQVNSSSYGFLKCGSVPNYCQSRQPEADNFGAGLGTFLKLFFNFMFMIWDSTQQDWQLCWWEFWTLNVDMGTISLIQFSIGILIIQIQWKLCSAAILFLAIRYNVATNFNTCHESTAVKSILYWSLKMRMRAKWFFIVYELSWKDYRLLSCHHDWLTEAWFP